MTHHCKDCRFFRLKSDRFGVCGSPDVEAQVHVAGKPVVSNVLRTLSFSQEGQDSILSELDIRVRDDFGCRHFEEEEPTADDSPGS